MTLLGFVKSLNRWTWVNFKCTLNDYEIYFIPYNYLSFPHSNIAYGHELMSVTAVQFLCCIIAMLHSMGSDHAVCSSWELKITLNLLKHLRVHINYVMFFNSVHLMICSLHCKFRGMQMFFFYLAKEVQDKWIWSNMKENLGVMKEKQQRQKYE